MILYCCLINCFNISSQWNTQIGYGIGFFDNKYSKEYESFLMSLENKDISQLLHRLNFKFEYQLENNLLFAVNSGIDVHRVYRDLHYIWESSDGQLENRSRYLHNSMFQNYKIGLSVGYLFQINDVSGIGLEVQYDHFFVNRIRTKTSYNMLEHHETIDNLGDTPLISSESYVDMIDFDKIGYRNRFVRNNRYFLFTLGYRFWKENIFFYPSVSYSYFVLQNFVRPPSVSYQNLFLINFNFGYTLPQKNKNDEK